MIAFYIVKLGNFKSDFLHYLTDSRAFGSFALLDIACDIYIVLRNIALLYECDFGIILCDAKAYYAGIREWKKRTAAIVAIGYFALIAAIFRAQLHSALRTKIKVHALPHIPKGNSFRVCSPFRFIVFRTARSGYNTNNQLTYRQILG